MPFLRKLPLVSSFPFPHLVFHSAQWSDLSLTLVALPLMCSSIACLDAPLLSGYCHLIQLVFHQSYCFAFFPLPLPLLSSGCSVGVASSSGLATLGSSLIPKKDKKGSDLSMCFFNLNFAKLCFVLFTFSLCLCCWCCCLLWCCLCFSFWISRSSSLPFSFSPTSSPSPPFALRFFVFRIRPSILPTLPFELVKTKLGSPIDLSWEAMLVKNKFKANLGWRLNRWLGAFEKNENNTMD